jgi:hypothetical protein
MEQNVEIFTCYAHADQELLSALKSHLTTLQRIYPLSIWADADISPGAEWENEIHKHLNSAQIILLLISADFIQSEYCYSKEMTRAMERHEKGEAHVIPIILRPVYWQRMPFEKLQALPKQGKPITDESWHTLDNALLDVTNGIAIVIEELMSRLPVSNLQILSTENREISASLSISRSPASSLKKFSWLVNPIHLLEIIMIIPLIISSAGFIYISRISLIKTISPPSSSINSDTIDVFSSGFYSIYWALSGKPEQYTVSHPPKQTIGVLYTNGHLSDPLFSIVFTLHFSGTHYKGVIIDAVRIITKQIKPIRQAVNIWNPENTSEPTHDAVHLYEALFIGTRFQEAISIDHQYNRTKKDFFTLPNGDADSMAVHVISRVEADVTFYVQIVYHYFGVQLVTHSYEIPTTYEVMFIDPAHWQQFHFQVNHLVRF